MIAPLLERLTARFIFVVGKGGTGKTTTAGAISLALSEHEQTLLLSTDPAHSIGDLFQQALTGITVSQCNPRLRMEELDARAHAERWSAHAEPHLRELVERGTYLDESDADTLAHLSLPGIDELLAALRLVDAAAEPWQRIVIDTAPTGHTLRLLDSAEQIDRFVRALRPMEQKGAAVASQLLRVNARLHAATFLDEMEQYATGFRKRVLADSEFVVVTRAGAVVHAETQRLRRDLERRRLRIAAVLCSGGGCHEVDALTALRSSDAAGCDGLRAWKVTAAAAPEARADVAGKHDAPKVQGAPDVQDNPDIHDALAVHASGVRAPAEVADSLDSLDVTAAFFAGKGGVGKSTCAAAVALHWSRTREVWLLSTDPAGSLGDVLERELAAEGSRVTPALLVRQLDAEAIFERLRDEYHADVAAVFEQLGLDDSAVLDRRVIDAIWDTAPPGMDEIISLIEIMDAPEQVMLVVDAAPTGHFLRLMEMPELALEWARALMRLMIKYRVATLDDAARGVLALAKRLKELQARLLDPRRTAIFIVTLPEPMVRSETERLLKALTRAGLPVQGLILNRADAGATVPGSAPLRFNAPFMREPPIGIEPLRNFLARWTLSA